jgi:hypothetical protein
MKDNELAEFFGFGCTVQVIISLLFLVGRLMSGMPAGEAFARFAFAVLLGIFVMSAITLILSLLFRR